jgi:hypothetical protein
MAKATTVVPLTTAAWTKVADSGVTYSFYVKSGVVLLHYSSASPAVNDGERFVEGEHCGDTLPTQNAWMRSSSQDADGAVVILHKE